MIHTILSIVGIIFLWQIFCFIVYEIGHENEELLTTVSMCFVVGFVTVFNAVYQALKLWYARRYLNGYGFCYPNGCMPYSIVYMIDELADKFCQDESAPYHIVKVCEGKTFKSAPYKNDVYKGEGGTWHGHPIEKFLKKD